MGEPFNDITNRFAAPKPVTLHSKNGQYYCESNQHILEKTDTYFFRCNECKKEYEGPLLQM